MTNEPITTRFDGYIRYLNSYIYRNQLYIAQSMKEVDVCMVIKEILEEKSRGRRIPYSFYEKLSKISCPNRNIVAILTGSDDAGDEENQEDNMICHETDCVTCWKNYIDETLAALENSEVVIKKFIPDILNGRFIEMYEKVGEEHYDT